jgi:hypothetical protein
MCELLHEERRIGTGAGLNPPAPVRFWGTGVALEYFSKPAEYLRWARDKLQWATDRSTGNPEYADSLLLNDIGEVLDLLWTVYRDLEVSALPSFGADVSRKDRDQGERHARGHDDEEQIPTQSIRP